LIKEKILRIIFVILLILSLNTNFILAESDNKKDNKPKKNWSLLIKGGITLNAGNTDSRLFTGGFDFHLKVKKIEYHTNLEAFYGAGNDVETVNKGKWIHKIAHKNKKKFGVYGTLSMEYDKFAQIAFRGNGGVGVRYTLLDSPKTSSHLAASLNGEFTDALANIANMKSFRLNLNYTLAKDFSSTTKFYFDLLHTSNWGNFFNDFRLEMKASISALVKNPFNLRVEIQEKYTNHPLEENLEKNDFIFVTSLEITL